jgi:hypothetical protein
VRSGGVAGVVDTHSGLGRPMHPDGSGMGPF